MQVKIGTKLKVKTIAQLRSDGVIVEEDDDYYLLIKDFECNKDTLETVEGKVVKITRVYDYNEESASDIPNDIGYKIELPNNRGGDLPIECFTLPALISKRRRHGTIPKTNPT